MHETTVCSDHVHFITKMALTPFQESAVHQLVQAVNEVLS